MPNNVNSKIKIATYLCFGAFFLNLLSATGTGIFVAALLAGLSMKMSLRGFTAAFVDTLILIRFALITVAALMAIGFIARYSGMDATLGTASTGSDTSSNVLFGSLQKLSPRSNSASPPIS